MFSRFFRYTISDFEETTASYDFSHTARKLQVSNSFKLVDACSSINIFIYIYILLKYILCFSEMVSLHPVSEARVQDSRAVGLGQTPHFGLWYSESQSRLEKINEN